MKAPFAIQPFETFQPETVGAWAGVPMDAYHKLPGESNSRLAILEQNPMRYRLWIDGVLQINETHDMQIGTLFHTAFDGGEPTFYLQPLQYGPENKPWHNGAVFCIEWRKAHADKPILTEAEAGMLNTVSECLRQHVQLRQLLQGTTPEVSAFARNIDLERPYLLRCRFDRLGHDERGWYFIDAKTTRDASTSAFAREILNRKYHAQMALYKRILDRLTGEESRCYILAIEKNRATPRCNLRQLSAAALAKGAGVLDARLTLLRRCRLSNRYPALPDDEGMDEIQFIDLPDYAYSEDDLTGMEEGETPNE